MRRNFTEDEDDQEDLPDDKPTPVVDLPYYNTLRTILEPYTAAADEKTADETFTSTEIIQQIEMHHGVPQGVAGKCIQVFVEPEDFVRAMEYLGFRSVNTGGLTIQWIMKKK